MEYWVLQSVIIQLLLAMGLANDHDRASDGQEFLSLKYSIDIFTLKNVTGATFYTDNRLLIYSETVLIIVDLLNNSRPVYKYLVDFNPSKLVSGFGGELFLLAAGKHCVRSFDLNTRQINNFSGDCLESGFVDGNKDEARYNNPKDIQPSGELFYVADYGNDCVRSVSGSGDAKTLISIHSHPFELAGDLLVAAQPLIIYEVKMKRRYKTYVKFIDSVNVASMETCFSQTLSMLSNDTDKHLKLLPLSPDTEHHTTTIAGPFDGLVCHENMTMVFRLISSKPNLSTMQIYSVDTENATEGTTLTPVSSTTVTIASSLVSNVHSTSLSTADSEVPETTFSVAHAHSVHHMTTARNHVSTLTSRQLSSQISRQTSLQSSRQTSPQASRQTSSVTAPLIVYSSTSERAIVPLHNHAHEPFEHLPSSYKENNKAWTVVLPVALAIVTVVVVLAVFLCIVYKRSGRRRSEDRNENEMDELNEILLSENSMTQPEMVAQYSQKTSLNGHRQSNGHCRAHEPKANGHAVVSNGNGGLSLESCDWMP